MADGRCNPKRVFHGVPFAATPIPEDSGACKMSSMMMICSCIILNCCNSKIAKCFTTWMRVAFFLHSQIVRSTVQQLHFSREVPRAKARQQLREAQNNDASRGLGEETGWLCGGARFKIHLTHYFKYFIHPWRNNPNALQFIQLEPPKNMKKPSNNGDSIGMHP